MKNLVQISAVLLFIYCSEKPAARVISAEENSAEPLYDTVAIDSFSAGATTVDIARQIRESSRAYQDSLLKNRAKIEAEKLLAKEAAEKEKLQKKLDEEKKKADALKIKTEKTTTVPEVSPTENEPTP